MTQATSPQQPMSGLHVLIVPAWWPSREQPIAGVFVQDYVRAFAAAGARVGVIYPDLVSVRHMPRRPWAPVIPRLAQESFGGIPVVRIRGLHTAFGRPARQMGRFLKWLQRGYDYYVCQFRAPGIIHAHCAIPAGWAAQQLQTPARCRVVITEHTGPFSLALTPPAAGAFTRSALADADAVVAVSPQLRDQMRAAGIDRPIEIIANPVSQEFAWRPTPPIESSAEGRRQFHVVFVGRLVMAKGVRELARAAVKLAGDPRIDVRWHLVGDGPEAAFVRDVMRSANLSYAVTMHGYCGKSGVAERLRAAHLLVLPSYGESFSLVIAEALCVGRPVVATRGTGCEMLVGPEDGMLCPPRDADGLADAIGAALSQYSRWNSAEIATRARVRFGSAGVASQYAALFHRVQSER